MKKIFLLLLVSLSLCFAQEVKTYGVSPAVAHHSDTDIFDLAYNGLTNVGVGTKVFLVGVGDTLVSPTWEITAKPSGSVAAMGTTLDGMDYEENYTQISSFTADVKGKYTITFTNNGETATIDIYAALYMGVDNCASCHSSESFLQVDDMYEKWQTTGHSDMLERGLNGTASSHYGESCISCHTTGYDVNAMNNGFDDFDFVFPAHPAEGVYDSLANVYQDAMARGNIQCESCHGPGSEHFGNPAKMAVTVSSDNCAICHDENNRHYRPNQWNFSKHGQPEVYQRGSTLSCAPCHSGSGFIAWMDNGKEALEEAPTPTAITCATCHDPHFADATDTQDGHIQLRTIDATLKNGEILTDGGRGKICMNCHQSRQAAAEYAINSANVSSRFGPHHGPQGDLVTGKNIPIMNDDLTNVYAGHYTFVENSCVSCHMNGDGDVNAEVNMHGGHTFSMVDAVSGEDNMAACTGCHPSYSVSFDKVVFNWNGITDFDEDGDGTEGLQAEIAGLLDNVAMLLEPVGEPTISYADVKANFTEAKGKAFYNYEFILEDRSGGIHNPKLAIGLLIASIRELGGVTSITEEMLMPSEYALSQNYPNPFNPETKINYVLPMESNVRVTIFNTLGQEVTTLVNESQSMGSHTVTFNAVNLASGIYFYRLEANDFVQVKKMLLMK